MTKKTTPDVQEPEQGAAAVAPTNSEQAPLETTEPSIVNTAVAPGGGDPEQPAVLVECAVLLDCIYGKHDEIVTLTESEAKSAQAGGYVDTHPNAVKAIRGQ